jgi:hypothetical protein
MSGEAEARRRRARHTPQVPPLKPTVTRPPSTITGTCRPPDSSIIRWSSFWSDLTLM